ncbi:MAG: hypothetical protein QOD06_3258 [Candidatus Binatota bacterium]|nr:hypothetical protein [Candidatus Binatota bacterium]
MVTLSCEEVHKRFDVFLDGETDGRSMRELALHLTRCAACEAEFRRYELVGDLFRGSIESGIDRVHVPALWTQIEAGLEPISVSFPARLRGRFAAVLSAGFGHPVLALGAAVFVIAMALGIWSAGPREASLHVASNEAHIERLSSSEPNVVLWTEPEEHTTAIWVTSYQP